MAASPGPERDVNCDTSHLLAEEPPVPKLSAECITRRRLAALLLTVGCTVGLVLVAQQQRRSVPGGGHARSTYAVDPAGSPTLCRHVCPGRRVGGGGQRETGPQSGHLDVVGLWDWSKWPWVSDMAGENEITIVHFNDVYQIAPVSFQDQKRGGLMKVARVVGDAKARNPKRTLVLAPGDFISPSTLSALNDGKQMIDIMNMLSIDAASLGNHEFDFGVDILQNRVQESKFPWLSSNLLNVTTNEPICGSTYRVIKDLPFTDPEGVSGMVRVCMFGVSYDVRDAIFKDQEFIKYVPAIEQAKKDAADLRENHTCKVVIALTHQAASDDCAMSRELGTAVDLLVGGHDHTTMLETTCGNAPYIKAASDAKTVWTTTLRLGRGGAVDNVAARVEPMTASSPDDPKVAARVAQWEAKLQAELKARVGCSDVDLDARSNYIRQGENSLGNFMADSIRYISPHHEHTIDAAIVNSGGIRGNRVWSKGEITMERIKGIHPFGNIIVEIYVNGSTLRKYINNCLSCYEDRCGDFPQVSNLKFAFSKRTLKVQTLTFENGTVIAPTTKLSLATTDFQYKTSVALQGSPLYFIDRVNDGLPYTYYIRKHIASHEPDCIHPKTDGRITINP